MEPCPHEFIDFAHRLADAGGEVHRRAFRKPIPVEEKEDLSPVSTADLECERLLRERIEAAYPEHGITGEEFPAVREDAEYVWLIDPIDGTKSFLTGKPMFGLLIALARRGRFILGLIDQAILRDRWVGADGHGTLLNGEKVTVRACPSLDEAVLYTVGPDDYAQADYPAMAPVRKAVKWVQYGAECYAYGLLAMGLVDLIVDADLDDHDFAALEPIVRNAGGVMSDWQGRPLIVGGYGRVIAAGDKALHAQALDLLGG